MRKLPIFTISALFVLFLSTVPAQLAQTADDNTPLSGIQQKQDASRENREKAYAKMLEGQRFLWISGRQRSQQTAIDFLNKAKASFTEAVTLDPQLAEAYTALAEIALSASGNVEDAILYASTAVKANPDNFGARRILARLFTFKSRLSSPKPEKNFADRAIAEWKLLTTLDPRNAEAWAFLSAFYEKNGMMPERIASLRKWISSAPPLEAEFYARLMGGNEALTVHNASVKLGEALLKSGEIKQAIETLSLVVSEDSDDDDAIVLLRQAIDASNGDSSAVAIESLQQAVYAKPNNVVLLKMLALLEFRAGKEVAAEKLLRDAAELAGKINKMEGANILLALGDLYFEADKFLPAALVYKEVLKTVGFDKAVTLNAEEKEFATSVFEKIVGSYKAANRPKDVLATIELARRVLGKGDFFADRQLTSFYRQSGKNVEALATVRRLRIAQPQDIGVGRLEATITTELGRVDEAISNYTKFTKTLPATGVASGSTFTFPPPTVRDTFSDYLFISSLYNQADRPKEAIGAAGEALKVAKGVERRQIAKLTLATAQQMSGDFPAAEKTLREILAEMPRNPIALNNLGYFMVLDGQRYDEAIGYIRQALEIDPKNPSYMDSLGWAYFKTGKLDDAEKYLKAAARLDMDSFTIFDHLGDLYHKMGNAELAKANWNKALLLADTKTDKARVRTKLK